MSWLSKLFGKGDAPTKGTQFDPEVRKIFEKIDRLLRDDDAQLELPDPEIRDVLKRAPFYDKSPNGFGPFGFCKTNPIPTNGPIGELAYLSKLVTNGGERLLFHRLGSVDDNIDIFEAVTFSGGQWFILFLDMYHPKKSRLAPAGFVLSKEACQFSGLNNHCPDFPYDFAEMKHRSGLGPAYMPMGDIARAIASKAYDRPAAHMKQLRDDDSRLVSPVGEPQTSNSKADYYSLIAQAVSELPTTVRLVRRCTREYARRCLDNYVEDQNQRSCASNARSRRLSTGLRTSLRTSLHKVRTKKPASPTRFNRNAR
jgi:hypothetical protein